MPKPVASAEGMMELQRKLDREGLVEALVKAKGPSWGEGQLTPEARARLKLFTEAGELEEVERPGRRGPPASPLDGGDGGDGGDDETSGTGIKTLVRTLVDDEGQKR